MKKYEELYKELEDIVKLLQGENVEVDEAIKLFKRAIKLKNECDIILNDANEQVVRIIQEESDE